MNLSNIVEKEFSQASQIRQRGEEVKNKLVEGVLELNSAKKLSNSLQKELNDCTSDISKIQDESRLLKVDLLMALIERDKLSMRLESLKNINSRLINEIEDLKEETGSLLHGGDVDQLCHRYSTEKQLELLNKLENAHRQLNRLGLPANYIR